MIVTAVYEKGVLRPLTPLSLADNQTVTIQILAKDQMEQILADLIAAGVVTSPSGTEDDPPLTSAERRQLADRLAQASAQPLSEIILREREEH